MPSSGGRPPLDHIWRFGCFNQLFWILELSSSYSAYQCCINTSQTNTSWIRLSHACVDDNVACEISHFSRSKKRFYDQVFELLDGSSGGVVVDSFQLHNTVKHCGLSSRRSRVQIPAGALHNSSIMSIDTHYFQITSISKAFTSIFNLFDNLRRKFLLLFQTWRPMDEQKPLYAGVNSQLESLYQFKFKLFRRLV